MSTAGAGCSPSFMRRSKSSQRSLKSPRSPASFGRAQEHQAMRFSSKCGWLKVFEGKKRKERWCVIDDDTVVCYKGPSARKEKGRLQLAANTNLSCEQGSNARILQVEWRLPGNAQSHISQFSASDPCELSLWVACLRHNIGVLQGVAAQLHCEASGA